MSKRPIVIEIDPELVTEEAKRWVEEEASDLAWYHPNYVDRELYWIPTCDGPMPKEIEHYSLMRVIEIFNRRDIEAVPYTKTLDAFLFASNKDAVYFKMRFL